MRKRSKARFANGVISALIVVFFIAHSLLGGLEGLTPLPSPPVLVIWAGVAIVVVHVLTSIVTSYEQLADAEFPPSPRKKRHLLLKWATGGLLAALAIAHIVCVQTYGPDAVQVSIASTAITLALVAALAVHGWVGAKSLVADLGLSKSLIGVFRAVVCVLAIAIACIALAGVKWR